MTKLHCLTHGRRRDPALLLVHALGTDHRFWDEAVAGLAAQYYCITPDLQAAGQTPRPSQPVDAASHAADLEELREALGIRTVVAIGCAVGGMIAAIYSARYPTRTRGLVMTNPGVRNAEAVTDILRERVGIVRQHGMGVLLPAAAERSFHGMPKDARFERYVNRYRAQDPEDYAASVLGVLDIDISAYLPAIRCPVLLIPGGHDILMPADSTEIICGLVPQAEVIRMEDVAHFIPFQAPERFVAAVSGFLSRTIPAA